MSTITYQLSPLLQQQTATSVNLPIRYNHIKLPFANTSITYSSGPWGVMINQQVDISGHIYEEQYFEPQSDVEVLFMAPKALLALQCMLLGDIKTNCGIHLKEGKLCLHYMPAGTKYSMTLLAGKKYQCFYIIPKLHFLEEFTGDYAPLHIFIEAINLKDALHQMLPVRRFSIAEHGELNKMKNSLLRGKAGIIYYGNRITDIILLYLEQLDMPVSREVFLMDLYEKEIDALIVRIDASPEEIFPITELAFKIGISEHILETAFKLKRGMTLLLYVQQQRLKMARHLLGQTNDSVSGIALNVGYADQSYFSKLFKRETGSTPSDYRKSFLVQKGTKNT
jgi:AraC-like DNA-binding protein